MASDLKGRTHNGGQQQQRTGGGKEEAMLPFVSITPIGKGDAQVTEGLFSFCTRTSLYASYSLLLISNKFWMEGGKSVGEK
jgi:hypothetical protein